MEVVLWDCDGVLFNSNRAKNNLFSTYLQDANKAKIIAEQPHLSRYQLFHLWFPHDANEHLQKFGQQCQALYESLPLAAQAVSIAKKYRSIVLTNSSQEDVEHALQFHGERNAFNKVLGQPTTKYEHVRTLYAQGYSPMALVGDGRLDFEVARLFDIPFVFFAPWSLWKDGRATAEYVANTWDDVDRILFSITSWSSI